jgi:outer membrane biosynthesis protein TonB
LLLDGNLTGSGEVLNVELGDGPLMFMAENDTEVGPLTIEGADTSEVATNGVVTLVSAKLNSSDGEPVNLSHIFFTGNGDLGPLTTSDADLDVGSPDHYIEVASATLDAASHVEFNITGEGTAPQVDYSQLVSRGAIELAGAKLEAVVRPSKKGEPCPTLTPGETYTLVSTIGTLSGSFSNAPEHGAEIPIRFAEACKQLTQTMRIAYHENGGTETVTGTVEAEVKEKQEAEERQRDKETQEARERQESKEEETRRKNEEAAVAKKREEEAAVAAGRHQEEELAAVIAKEFQEEAATAKGKEESADTSNVSLAGTTIAVQGGDKAQVKLTCTGSLTCDGKLTLTAKGMTRKGKAGKTEIIGTANFSIAGGKAITVGLKLNPAGRTMVDAGHGRLSATLKVVKYSPVPSVTRAEGVRLVRSNAKT